MRSIQLCFFASLLLLIGCAGGSHTSITRKPGAKIDITAPTFLISEDVGLLQVQDNTFRDMLGTELLKNGVNLVDKAGPNVRNIITVNARMVGDLISRATCKVTDTAGSIIMSLDFTNPAAGNGMYIGNRGTSSVIREWAAAIAGKSQEEY